MDEIILFEKKQVRRVQIRNEWWFVIKDVVAVLTESKNPSDYLKKLKKRDNSLNESFKGGGQLVPPLNYPLIHLVENKYYNAGIQWAYCV